MSFYRTVSTLISFNENEKRQISLNIRNDENSQIRELEKSFLEGNGYILLKFSVYDKKVFQYIYTIKYK